MYNNLKFYKKSIFTLLNIYDKKLNENTQNIPFLIIWKKLILRVRKSQPKLIWINFVRFKKKIDRIRNTYYCIDALNFISKVFMKQ